MEKDFLPTAVSTIIDEETARSLLEIKRTLDMKPAAVTRLGLKRVIPELLQLAKSNSASARKK